MRVAAVDVGSNSTRLLVADVDESGAVSPVHAALETTRLGQGITAGRLLPGSMERTLAVITEFISRAKSAGAREVVLAATSAVRDAANRDDFVRGVQSATGRPLRVLSGAEEAQMGYLGVTRGLDGVDKAVVVDIGGGSTEFTWLRDGRVRYVSIKAGAVRMSEGGYGQGQIREAIGAAIETVRQDGFDEVVAVGGTATTLAAMTLGLRRYDPGRVHGFRLDRSAVNRLDRELHGLTVEERKKLPGLQPQRADIIPAGARILSRVLYGLHADSVLVSEADMLYGLVIEVKRLSQFNCNKIPK